MALGFKRSAGSERAAFSPILLAIVLALLWVVLSPSDGGISEVPDWGLPIVIGTRFVAGFVMGWVAISAAQLVLRLAWFGASHFYLWTRKGKT